MPCAVTGFQETIASTRHVIRDTCHHLVSPGTRPHTIEVPVLIKSRSASRKLPPTCSFLARQIHLVVATSCTCCVSIGSTSVPTSGQPTRAKSESERERAGPDRDSKETASGSGPSMCLRSLGVVVVVVVATVFCFWLSSIGKDLAKFDYKIKKKYESTFFSKASLNILYFWLRT